MLEFQQLRIYLVTTTSKLASQANVLSLTAFAGVMINAQAAISRLSQCDKLCREFNPRDIGIMFMDGIPTGNKIETSAMC